MNLNDLLDNILFTLGEFNISVGNIILTLLLLIILIVVYSLLNYRFFPYYFKREEVSAEWQKKILRLNRFIFLFLALLSIVLGLGIDYELFVYEKPDGTPPNNTVSIRVSMIFQALLVFQFARLLDWVISKVLIHNYHKRRAEEQKAGISTYKKNPEATADRTVQYFVYALAVLLIIQQFNINDTLFSFENNAIEYQFTLSNILKAVLIVLAARLAGWILTQLVLFSYYKRQRINIGAQYAFNQLLQYFLYVIAILFALESLGVQLTVLWGGAAALLVGIGLGLQQTFNDFISGILLLFERTVEVGDVVQVDGLIGAVKKIGIRTSLIESWDNITVVVPNSKLTVEKVVNWSHYDNKARFSIKLGVAYGSNTQLVKQLLIKVAQENVYVLKYPASFVRFKDFGNSSLDFELHFWAQDFQKIEDIKSDIRFEIDAIFRENNVEIPFPQSDIWFRNLPKQ